MSPLPFSWSGNRAVLVYDKEDPDGYALLLAHAWPGGSAAAISPPKEQRSTPGASRQPSPKPDDTRQAPARPGLLHRRHQEIDERAGHMTALVEEIRAALAELSEELNKN